MSSSNHLNALNNRKLDDALLPVPNGPENATPAIANEGLGDEELGYAASEDEIQFSCILFDADSADVASSTAQLQNGHAKSRDAWSSVMIVETAFRALGLSAIGTRKQRILFAMWSLWFLARAVFMIAELIILRGFPTSQERICEYRSTILSSNGLLNRPLQTAIHIFDFLGWMLIFFSSLGGRCVRCSLCALNLQSLLALLREIFSSRAVLLHYPSPALCPAQLALLPPPGQPSQLHAAALQQGEVAAAGLFHRAVRCDSLVVFGITPFNSHLLHSLLHGSFLSFAAFALFNFGWQVPLIGFYGNSNCPLKVVETILVEGVYNLNCRDSLDSMLVALAFDRRPILGNSLSYLPYDILSQVSLFFIAILTPLRILTIMNCANRALREIAKSHFSARRSAFDSEAFFSDFRIVSNLLVRIQRLLPLSRSLPLLTRRAGSWAFRFFWL